MALLSSCSARCPPPCAPVSYRFTRLCRPWYTTNRSPITVETVDITPALRKLRETSQPGSKIPSPTLWGLVVTPSALLWRASCLHLLSSPFLSSLPFAVSFFYADVVSLSRVYPPLFRISDRFNVIGSCRSDVVLSRHVVRN